MTGNTPDIIDEDSDEAAHLYASTFISSRIESGLADPDGCIAALSNGNCLHIIADVGRVVDAGFDEEHLMRSINTYVPIVEQLLVEGEASNGD